MRPEELPRGVEATVRRLGPAAWVIQTLLRPAEEFGDESEALGLVTRGAETASEA